MRLVRGIVARLGRQEGFGLIELLIAMTVLSVGLLALFAAYTTSYVTMRRATQVSSATVLADSQMERYRALSYANIKLNTSLTQDSTYTSDAAYSSAAQFPGCTSTTDPSCLPTQSKTGPDGRTYRLDTYIALNCVGGALSASSPPSCSTGAPVKVVTIVVRNSSGGAWVREASDFDALSG
jgi:type IV pilus modification protein PilV